MPSQETHPALLFEETQTFRQAWIWGILVGVFLFVGGSFVAAWVGHPELAGREFLGGVLFLAIWGAVAGLLAFMRLTVEVDRHQVLIRFAPLTRRQLPVNDIAEYEVRTYSPILEYGGWGIRCSWKGMAYNVSGNRGVQLVLRDGRRILIGSQKPQELAEAIARAKTS